MADRNTNSIAAIWQLAVEHAHQTWDHGPEHWTRVERNALWLCRVLQAGEAVEQVCRCFAACHDAAREHDGMDGGHGPRAAALIKTWRPDLDERQFDELILAVSIHTVAQPPRPIPLAVQICLDADRLDIGRVGFLPHRDYLWTDTAKELADRRGVPELDAMSLPVTRPEFLRPTPGPYR